MTRHPAKPRESYSKIHIYYFKMSIFKPKLSFWGKIRTNYNEGEFSDFNKFTLYMIFAIFLKMAISIMIIFLKIFENHK